MLYDMKTKKLVLRRHRRKLDEETANTVVSYLRRGKQVLITSAKDPDLLKETGIPEVGLSMYTDGIYIWSEAEIHYIKEHRLNPGTEFVKHTQTAKPGVALVSEKQISEALNLILKEISA